MKKSMTLLLAVMMLLGMVTVANATTPISYIGSGGVPFGGQDWATVGQTFNLSVEGTGDNNLLDSVTFWVTTLDGDFEFKFYLYEWDGAEITGGPLLESGPMSTQAGNQFTVDVGGVELDVDQDYVFFVSTSDSSYGQVDAAMYLECFPLFPWFPKDPTPDHKLFHVENDTWVEHCSDMAFTMELSASEPELGPEPAATATTDATFELTRAKVDLKKGKIKVDGDIILPEDVIYEDLEPVGTVKLRLFEIERLVEAVAESVDLEVKGRNGEKWQYKKRHDKKRHAFGVTEYKVHWKDDQTGKVKIKADFDPGQVDLSRLTPKLVVEFTLGKLEFELTMAENGQYDCKLKKKKWDFHNKL